MNDKDLQKAIEVTQYALDTIRKINHDMWKRHLKELLSIQLQRAKNNRDLGISEESFYTFFNRIDGLRFRSK